MQENNETLTKEFCTDKTLLFYPKTEKETRFIQEQLFKMGFAWTNYEKKFQCVHECIENGLMLSGNEIWRGTFSKKSLKNGILCKPEQFETKETEESLRYFSGDNLSVELFERLSKQMLGQFNEMSQHIKTLEGEIEELKNPSFKNLDKPVQKTQ